MYVHLISNASLSEFPENKLSDFRNQLCQPLKLSGDECYVALSEIHIPFTFDVIKRKDAYIETLVYDESSTKKQETIKEAEITLSNEGVYHVRVPDGFMLQLEKERCGLPKQIFGDSGRVYVGDTFEGNEDLSEVVSLHRVSFTRTKHSFMHGYFEYIDDVLKVITNQQISFKINGKFIQGEIKTPATVVHLSDHLANIFGYRQDSLQRSRNTARFLGDLFPGLNCFMVYVDFIEDSFIGDTRAPLLRMLPPQNVSYGQYMTYQCFPLQYKKVLRHEISTIRVLLRDDIGRPLPFGDRGRVTLSLDFRQHAMSE